MTRPARIRRGPLFSVLDFTLAWRMLVRYRGLSLVSVLGMSLGIAIAAGAFTIVSAMMGTQLPLPEGERLVSLLSWDASTNSCSRRGWHLVTSSRQARETRLVRNEASSAYW